MTAEAIVAEMRVLLANLTDAPDWPTLAAHVSLALPSTPTPQLIQLQSAADLADFWPALVRAVMMASDPADAAAALQCLRARTNTTSATPSWALKELALLPGASTPSTPAPSASPPPTPAAVATPPPALSPASSLSGVPPQPTTLRVRITGLRGLSPSDVSSAFVAAFPAAGSLPEFAPRP